MNVDIRSYIINNFKDDSIDDIRKSIDVSISSLEEDPLLGLGVMFELLWKGSNEELKADILNILKLGINNINKPS